MFEIGNSLREARARRGIGLPEAEAATKIRSKYLRALEDERFELLPAETYVKGFLRSYADYLGLDGQLYVDEYNSRYVVDEESPRVRRPSTYAVRSQRRAESRVLVVALAGIAAATALVIVAWKWGGAEQQAVPGLAAETAGPAVRAPRAQPPQRPANAWIELVLRARGSGSWVSVHRGGATGRLLFEGTLEGGRSDRFTGRSLWINASSPRNLRATVDGRSVRFPGNGSRPAVVVVTRRGIAPAAG